MIGSERYEVNNDKLLGYAFMVTAASIWGAMYVIGKSVMGLFRLILFHCYGIFLVLLRYLLCPISLKKKGFK